MWQDMKFSRPKKVENWRKAFAIAVDEVGSGVVESGLHLFLEQGVEEVSLFRLEQRVPGRRKDGTSDI